MLAQSRERGILTHRWWDYKLVQSLGTSTWKIFNKLKENLSHEPDLTPLTFVKKTRYPVLEISAISTISLFTIARKLKQLKCPSANKWITKMLCMYTMECYPFIKKTEIMRFAWMELGNIRLSEVTQTQKHNHCQPLVNLSAKSLDLRMQPAVAKEAQKVKMDYVGEREGTLEGRVGRAQLLWQ